MGVRQNRQPEEFHSFLSKTDYPGGTDAKNVIGGKNPFHRLTHRLSYRSPFLPLFWCRLRSVSSGFHLKDGEFGVFLGKIGVSGRDGRWENNTSPPQIRQIFSHSNNVK